MDIQDHPDWPDVIDAIKNLGSHSKGILITLNYDDSGEGLTKRELGEMDRGELLAMLIDAQFGGTCF